MENHLVANKLRCKICSSSLEAKEGGFFCTSQNHPWSDADPVPAQQKAFVEKIFDFPSFYQKKVKTLGFLNGIPQNVLDPLIEGEEVLDLGCGSFQYLYNPEKVPFRIGTDYSRGAVEGANLMYPRSAHFVSSLVEPLPFQDKSFDTTLILFVLHHLPPESVKKVIDEAVRVSRKYLLVVDHTTSEQPVKRKIQQTYWNTFDGGTLYRNEQQWNELWKDFKVVEHQRIGTLFKNICVYKLAL